jgi:UDP-N-acetylmuramoyl-tripeptide--D-alanyl-D-alanine ligase
MNPTSLKQVADFAGATIEGGDARTVIDTVSTDSRTLKPGQLFVALRGENFDGHTFVEAVANSGAAGAVVESAWKGTVPKTFALLRVADTLRAYQDLAARYRYSLPITVLAISGSNGKTSTKDFAAAVLARRFRVTKTEGNFNNHVGLPRTVLEATSRPSRELPGPTPESLPTSASPTSNSWVLANRSQMKKVL